MEHTCLFAVSNRQKPNTLDLHGFYVNEALGALQELLQAAAQGQSFVLVICAAHHISGQALT